MVIFGGITQLGNLLNDLWELNLGTLVWTSLPSGLRALMQAMINIGLVCVCVCVCV